MLKEAFSDSIQYNQYYIGKYILNYKYTINIHSFFNLYAKGFKKMYYSQTSVFDQSVYHFTSFSDLFRKIILRFSYTISVILQVKKKGKPLDKLTMEQIYIRKTSQLSRFTSFFDLLKISKK